MPYAHINSKAIFYTLIPPAPSLRPSSLTLLFIHGLGSSSSYFAPMAPYLTAQGHRFLALDTHGSGSSPYSGSGNSIASIASDARAILNELSIKENIIVIGHSMGGIVASQLAATDSERRFKAAVLIGPVNPNPDAAAVFSKRISIVEKEGLEPLAESIPVAATGTKCVPLVHAFIRSLLLSTSPEGYISLCRAIAEAPVPQYRNIEIPLLAIAGKEDMSAPRQGVEYIVERYGSRKKELRVLDGVGHWHVLEAYEQVQVIISSFLEEL